MNEKVEYKGYYYQIFEDGYDIFDKNSTKPFITQRDPFSRPFLPDGSFEDNAKAQIDDLILPPPEPTPSEEEKLRADVDYIALMGDYNLPSYNEQEGE